MASLAAVAAAPMKPRSLSGALSLTMVRCALGAIAAAIGAEISNSADRHYRRHDRS
jgi:hypothetical protein